MNTEMSVVFSYYFTFCGVDSEVPSFIPDIDNLCLFSFFFHCQSSYRFINFIDFFKGAGFNLIDSSLLFSEFQFY